MPTPTPSHYSGQRLPPGLSSHQPASDCLAMAQGVRLWVKLGAAGGEFLGNADLTGFDDLTNPKSAGKPYSPSKGAESSNASNEFE